MSVATISSANNAYQTNPYAQARQDFQNLGNALQSGNLTAAQQAFAQLQQSNPNIGQSQGTQNNSSASQAIQNLGNALQSGDLSGARQAFAQLQQGMQAAGKGHGHHHHSRQSSGTSQASQVLPTTYSNQGVLQDSGSTSTADSGTSTASTAAISILS
jgi:hypothetical protein